MEASQVIEAMKWRYATKQFDTDRKIPDTVWKSLESVLTLTPSGYGLQPWKFLVIQNPEVRRKLVPISLDQNQITDCSHFLVLASKLSIEESYIGGYIDEVAKQRNLSKEVLAGFNQMMIDDVVNGPKSKWIAEWAARQAYIALGNILTTAALLGIDACPLEGIIPEEYDEVLELKKSGYRTAVACAFGYRSADDVYAKRIKVRFDEKVMVQHL
jgi:nitroreductase